MPSETKEEAVPTSRGRPLSVGCVPVMELTETRAPGWSVTLRGHVVVNEVGDRRADVRHCSAERRAEDGVDDADGDGNSDRSHGHVLGGCLTALTLEAAVDLQHLQLNRLDHWVPALSYFRADPFGSVYLSKTDGKENISDG